MIYTEFTPETPLPAVQIALNPADGAVISDLVALRGDGIIDTGEFPALKAWADGTASDRPPAFTLHGPNALFAQRMLEAAAISEKIIVNVDGASVDRKIPHRLGRAATSMLERSSFVDATETEVDQPITPSTSDRLILSALSKVGKFRSAARTHGNHKPRHATGHVRTV